MDLPVPARHENEVQIKVLTCGVCHTELDEIEGRTPQSKFLIIPGHQVVGRVERNGPGAGCFKTGERVKIAWIHSSCGTCKFCKSGLENLCPEFKATGRDAAGDTRSIRRSR